MAGEITTLGVGSGLPLADILEDLREVDSRVVDMDKAKVADIETQLEEFTVVKNKLLDLKSSVLGLSLESTFMQRASSSSDEKVATISVMEGATVQSVSLNVEHLASKSSWMSSDGFESTSDIVNIAGSQDSSQTAASYTEPFVPSAGEITIEYGRSGDKAVITVSKGDTIGQLVNTINGMGLPLAAVAAQDEKTGMWALRVTHTDSDPATNRIIIDGGETGVSFFAPEAEFTYKVGKESRTITVAGDTTLQGIVDLVNSGSNRLGVTARIINSGVGDEPYKFVLQADNTGEDNRITISGQLSGLTMAEDGGFDSETGKSVSLNASLVLDGISYQRQTNSFSDILTGVTIDLQAAGEASISVSYDDAAIADQIVSVVEEYIDAVGEIKAERGYDPETKKFGTLSGSSVGNLVGELDSLISSLYHGDSEGKVSSMFDLGMEINRDGAVTIDRAVLTAKLASNREDVQEFFLGDDDREIIGFADQLNDSLRSLTGAMGPIESEKTTAKDRIYDLDLKMETENKRLDKKYELLTKQFVELDRYMSQMTSLSNYLTGQFDSLSDGWGSSKK